MQSAVRAYRQADLPAMLKIWNEVVEAGNSFPQEEILDQETGADFFAAQSYCGVCLEAGEIVGLYILHPNNVGRCRHICNASFAVASQVRGRGIGRLLVKDCLRQAARLGFAVIQFNAVLEQNRAARALYESLGFRRLGLVEKGFRAKNGSLENICLYWRPLDDPEEASQ